MSVNFSAGLTEDQLVKLLRDGFGEGIAKKLILDLQEEARKLTQLKLAAIEREIEVQVKNVVKHYMVKTVGMYNSAHDNALVINVNIEHTGEGNEQN